jgi:hypothetical protein
MHRRQLAVVSCANDWSQMRGSNTVRHCSSCAKDVYNLSMLTEREAEAALAVRPADVCIRYHFDADGQVVFFPEAQLRRRHAASRRTIAAAVAVSAMSACAQPKKAEEPGSQVTVTRSSAESGQPEGARNVPHRAANVRAPAAAHAAPSAAQDGGVPGPTGSCDPRWHEAFKRDRGTAHVAEFQDEMGGHPPRDLTPSAEPTAPRREQVLAALREARNTIESECKGPGVATAEIQIAGRSGKVTSVLVTGVKGSVAACVRRAVRRAVFPKFQRETFSLTFPFKLHR